MKDVVIKVIKILGLMILTFFLIMFGQGLGMLIASPLEKSSNEVLAFASNYLEFIGIWVLILAICLIFKKNRKYLPLLGKGGKGNNAKTILLVGLPCGIGLNLIVGLVAMIHGDIHLTYAGFNLPLVLLFIVVVTIQSGAEELATRWFLYQKVKDLTPNHLIVPVIVNAVFFSLLHAFNPGVTILSLVNIVFIAILYSLIIYYFDSFWAAVAAHASWNFCQNILLGLPNSGNLSEYSIFALDSATARDSFAYNVGFGIEGSVLSTIIIAVAIIVLIMIEKRKAA